MENFTNETLDTTKLPKFEEVQFTALQATYWKVMLINKSIVFSILAIGLFFVFYKIDEILEFKLQTFFVFIFLIFLTILLSRISFKKKGFAFRNHDVIYRSGIIATNTIVIPYNRVQHVALHEGLISRYFGLAKIEIFTAGGSSSDIEIPGIAKNEAENIKQLLMGKIQKQL
ncbi:PH domain-containing protein [Flavobacterium sp.]|uniref:PH domain-containing protein n=1 Tax=Flavobacterium sp. TaxID=239 RepID=UPI0038FC539E